MATKEEIKVIEKMAVAKFKLQSMIRGHVADCPVRLDPEYTGPCKCGASEINAGLKAAIKELSFE
jgi:hypothetical protein